MVLAWWRYPIKNEPATWALGSADTSPSAVTSGRAKLEPGSRAPCAGTNFLPMKKLGRDPWKYQTRFVSVAMVDTPPLIGAAELPRRSSRRRKLD